MILDDDFFANDAKHVAQNLVGKYIVRITNKEERRFLITETEAYVGEFDMASHARFGKTKRNSIMYGKYSYFYIYLIYGMYHMLNVVCGKENDPQAVLIRGIEGFNGPGKLTKALNIDMQFNGLKQSKKTGLYFEDSDLSVKIEVLPRVGIDYAGEWKDKLLRFKMG